MSLLTVLLQLTVIVLVSLVVVGAIVLRRQHLQRIHEEFGPRLRVGFPAVALLGLVLLLNALFRPFAEELSWLIGRNITGAIYAVEGEFVYMLQSTLGPRMVTYFAFVYVYGYVLLLVFPLIAYLMMRRLDSFQELTIAYAANYLIGLCLYILFIAYGPRNLIPEIVGTPMHHTYPEYHMLTSAINLNTNVFPSLHTSLSATVMIFAWRTRKAFPKWLPIAAFLGASIILATMYLAIHWVIDVIAGLGLAALSAWLGVYIHEKGWVRAIGRRVTEVYRSTRGKVARTTKR